MNKTFCFVEKLQKSGNYVTEKWPYVHQKQENDTNSDEQNGMNQEDQNEPVSSVEEFHEEAKVVGGLVATKKLCKLLKRHLKYSEKHVTEKVTCVFAFV